MDGCSKIKGVSKMERSAWKLEVKMRWRKKKKKRKKRKRRRRGMRS